MLIPTRASFRVSSSQSRCRGRQLSVDISFEILCHYLILSSLYYTATICSQVKVHRAIATAKPYHLAAPMWRCDLLMRIPAFDVRAVDTQEVATSATPLVNTATLPLLMPVSATAAVPSPRPVRCALASASSSSAFRPAVVRSYVAAVPEPG